MEYKIEPSAPMEEAIPARNIFDQTTGHLNVLYLINGQQFATTLQSRQSSSFCVSSFKHWSIVNIILSFLTLLPVTLLCSIPALMYSLKVKHCTDANQLTLADTYSRKARVLNIIATVLIGVAFLLWILTLVLWIYFKNKKNKIV